MFKRLLATLVAAALIVPTLSTAPAIAKDGNNARAVAVGVAVGVAAVIIANEAAKANQRNKTTRVVCARGYAYRDGRCHLIKRNVCAKGYVYRNGKCRWPTKNGYEVAPWTKPGCSALNNECKRGIGSSCRRYEERCQVN